MSNKVIGKLVILWRRTSDQQKEERDKREDFLWHTNPRLDLLEEQLNSDEIWFNKLEAEFVHHSVERKHRNRRVSWSGAIALRAIFSVLSVGAAISYQKHRKVISMHGTLIEKHKKLKFVLIYKPQKRTCNRTKTSML